MPIPLFGAQAGGGKLVSLDDAAVVKDLAALDGTGGSAYAPYVLSSPLAKGQAHGWATLRRLTQRVVHDGAVTLKTRAYRDGNDTGQEITRTLAVSDKPIVTAPFMATGSDFQVRLELSAFTAEAQLGDAEVTIIPRRSAR